MQTIYLQHPYHTKEIWPEEIVLALGFFDGVHRGHQAVLGRAVDYARQHQLTAAVMTFNQHPSILYQNLDPDSFQYLSTLDRKLELFAEQGLDLVYVVDYSPEFGRQAPQDFVDDYIVGLNARAIVAGFDYTYGPAEIANMELLPTYAQGRFEIIEIPEFTLHQHKVGSRTIKELLQAGEVQTANIELGYIYQNSGTVIHGQKRGRKLGYPTANIQVPSNEILPGIGVYVTELEVEGTWYPAMTSIGYNVTFDNSGQVHVEAHILDFDQMIYGQEVKIRWHQKIRPELKFDSAQALIDQLDQDLLVTRAYFDQEGQ